MGTLSVPFGGVAYVDANAIIYTVERHPDYFSLLEPLWLAAKAKTVEIISSELALMECLTGAFKRADAKLLNDYENALFRTELRLLPVTQSILRDAAQLRATTRLRTPDAIHAATSQQFGCSLFVTNDGGFRAVPGLPVVVLDDLRTP